MDLYYYASCLFSHLFPRLFLRLFLHLSSLSWVKRICLLQAAWSRSLISSCLCFFVVYRCSSSGFLFPSLPSSSSLYFSIVSFNAWMGRRRRSGRSTEDKNRERNWLGENIQTQTHEQNPLNTNELTRKERGVCNRNNSTKLSRQE